MTSLLLASLLAISPVETSLSAGVSTRFSPAIRAQNGLLPMLTLALTACVYDGLVLEADAGSYFIIWDAAGMTGWNWRVFGERQLGTVIDLRALVGAHFMGETPFMSLPGQDHAGFVAVGEVALVNWGDPPGARAFTAKLQAGAETSGFTVYPMARLTLGITL